MDDAPRGWSRWGSPRRHPVVGRVHVARVHVSRVVGRGGDPPPPPPPPPPLDLPTYAEDISVFFSVTPPSVGTAAYIGHVLTHARASAGVAIAVVALLDRAAAADGRLGLHPLNVHRLVTTAVVVAAKVVDERTYPLAHFARVGGFGGVAELARCERVLLDTLGWRLVVTRREYEAVVGRVVSRYWALEPPPVAAAAEGTC